MDHRQQNIGNHLNPRIADVQRKYDSTTLSDQNTKCILELTNGQVSRGLDYMEKQSNAVCLGSYSGALGTCLFLFDSVVSAEHLLLILHFALSYFYESTD